jgi:pantetheine-phosphate adenylyltransferase
MSSRIAVVPGSFDPPTLGISMSSAAASLYDELRARGPSPGKRPPRSAAALLEQSIEESDIGGNVVVASWSMGSGDYATDVGAGVLVKGSLPDRCRLRNSMAIVNRHLAHVETVFLLPDPLTRSCRVRSASGGPGRRCSPSSLLSRGSWGGPGLSPPCTRAGSMDPREKTQAGPFSINVRDIVQHPARCVRRRRGARRQQWGEGLVSVAG